MRAAPRIDIAASLPARAKFLTHDYADVLENPAQMLMGRDPVKTLLEL